VSRPWRERPEEERYALNPALLAQVIAQAAAGYSQEAAGGMPFALSYLAVPVVLHAETRAALPGSVATSMASWLGEHELLRRAVRARTVPFAPLVREGLVLGLRTGALRLDRGTLHVPRPNAAVPRGDLPELHQLLRAARLLGRLFARVGSASTVFAMWGVRP